MTTRHARLGVLVIAVVIVLVAANAMCWWGDDAARRGELILQVLTGVGAAAVGVVTAVREHGIGRWWRLLYVGALLSWVAGQVLWSSPWGEGAPDAAALVHLLVLPGLAFSSVVLVVRASGGLTGPPDGPLRQPLVTNVLDGIVTGLAFLILAVLGGFGTSTVAASQRAGLAAFDVVFALAELVVVGAVVLIAMIYEPGRPYRTNYLFLAGGLLMMASADRFVAYVRSVNAHGGELWMGAGLVIGPVLIAFGFLPMAPAKPPGRFRRDDWPQLLLPYMGFVVIAGVFAFHVIIDRELPDLAVLLTVAMVALVAVRQILATRAERKLTQSLYWAQRGLSYQVQHDALTGLPNRILLARRLDEAMSRGQFVLIFLDLDDFKEVNDRFGHAAGDELLQAVGERLLRCVADGDTLARIGGDEFAVLIDSRGDGHLEGAAERLRLALRDPFPVQGSSLRIKASMGLVRPDAEGLPQTSDDLLRQADIAMYASKRMGKGTAVVYNPSAGAVIDFPASLRDAGGTAPPGFRMVYQPVVRLPDGAPMAVEALARWTAANGIDISPETFVADAEAAGLGAELDALVLDIVCADVRSSGLELDIHVNIGAGRLGTPGFERQVRDVLHRHSIPRGRLVLEITETEPIADLDRAATQISRFGDLGIRVALDDFGAGFNSLLYLHCLPVHIVKLDRTLASGGEPGRDFTLYQSVIKLCDDLGLDVIAEGIETSEQADMVCRAGGRLGQGHLFGRPVPLGELTARAGRMI